MFFCQANFSFWSSILPFSNYLSAIFAINTFSHKDSPDECKNFFNLIDFENISSSCRLRSSGLPQQRQRDLREPPA
jgi:hypothetical protein